MIQWLKRDSEAAPEDVVDVTKLLQQYGHKLITTPLEIDLILGMLLQQIDEIFSPSSLCVFLRDKNQGVYSIHPLEEVAQQPSVAVQFGFNDDLSQWLHQTNQFLLPRINNPATQSNISEEELARLKMLDVELCVPLSGSEYLLGWVALGCKNSNTAYEEDDLVLLATLANQTAIALENAQLLEQANRRAAELEALQTISAQIQTEAQPDKLLTLVVEQATKLLQAKGGLVYLTGPRQDDLLTVVVSHNLGDEAYYGIQLNAGEDVAGQVLATDQPLRVDNYHNFSGRSPIFKDAEFGSVLGVPLRWGGKPQGVLQLVHDIDGGKFDDHDIWLIEFFATQSALSIEKSRLIEKAQKRASHLATLSEVSMAISSTLDLETALQRVMDRAVQILHAEAGSLLLVDSTGENLTFEVVLGPTGSELMGMKTPVGKGIVGSVAESGKPLIINDVASDPRWNVAFDEATDFRTKDIICVPMIAFEQQVVGVIELINKQDGSVFDDADSSLLVSFAAQAAIAIENAKIFTRTDQALAERVQELEALQMFDHELQSSLVLNNVLDITLTNVMDALGLSMGLIGLVREDEEGLLLLAQRGMPMEMGRYKIDPWPWQRGVIGRVARTGEVGWSNDISQMPEYIPKNHRTRSLLVVPIMRDERVIGVIDLESTEPDYFSKDDVSFVKLMSNHAAMAIENAYLFDQVRVANDAKTEFMNVAAHELKVPMTSIKGYAKLMKMGAAGGLTDKQTEFLGVIGNNVDRMARLVTDLLDVSRIEADRIRLELSQFLIQDVIDEVVSSLRTQIDNKNLNLSIEVDNTLPELRADQGRIIQIVTNLLSNAYKYTPENGAIWVSAESHSVEGEPGISVTVGDTGYGMSEEDQAKLFTNFFRSADENIRNEPGTGLGLSITKKMIETHGGELTFESELGKGTAFTFTLPLISQIPPGVEVVEK